MNRPGTDSKTSRSGALSRKERTAHHGRSRLSDASRRGPPIGSMIRRLCPRFLSVGARLCARLAIGLVRSVAGKPWRFPAFGSMTLEADDLAYVGHALSHPDEWADTAAEEDYQREFAIWNGSKCALAFAQGRVALSASIYALDLKPGDEVIIPNYTCIVVPNAFAYAGISIRYCDIELDTFGPEIDSVVASVTPRTKAIVVHHLYGIVCAHFDRILEFASQRRIRVIEDCAQATGATYRGRRVGNWGDVAFYSSEQSKVYSTFNGGIAVSNDEELCTRLKQFQDRLSYPDEARTRMLLSNVRISYVLNRHPYRWFLADLLHYKHRSEFMLSTTHEEQKRIQPAHYLQRLAPPLAVLGRKQLQKVDRFNRQRRAAAQTWREICASKGYRTPLELPNSEPVYLRYPVLVAKERKFDANWAIKEFGVQPEHWFVGEHHPIAMPLPECPNARFSVEHCINLPTLV